MTRKPDATHYITHSSYMIGPPRDHHPRNEEAMTDRTDHYTAATGEMLNALELAAEHDIPAQDQHYRAISFATIHALLAIHDALTDRYAANEARQREGQMEDAWQFRYWEPLRRVQDEAKRREAAQEAAGGDLSAPEAESGAEEGGEADDAVKPLLCPECGDHINTHNVEGCGFVLCDCPRTPEDVARALVADAVKAAWEAGTNG